MTSTHESLPATLDPEGGVTAAGPAGRCESCVRESRAGPVADACAEHRFCTQGSRYYLAPPESLSTTSNNPSTRSRLLVLLNPQTRRDLEQEGSEFSRRRQGNPRTSPRAAQAARVWLRVAGAEARMELPKVTAAAALLLSQAGSATWVAAWRQARGGRRMPQAT